MADINDIDYDATNLVPLNEELAKCSYFFDNGCEPNESQQDSTNNCKSTDEILIYSIPGSSKSNNIVCQSPLSGISNNDHENELISLGVSVYDQTQFENQVMHQVDEAIKAHDEKKRRIEVEKKLKSVSDDIRFAKKHLNQIEKVLSTTSKDFNSLTPVAKRKIDSIREEHKNKLKHLKKLEAKQKTLQACISENAEDITNSLQEDIEGEEDMDDETKYHVQKVFDAKETEEERLIRVGEMTPFGTSASPVKKQPKKIVISENQQTEFEKFLLTEAEAHAKKSTKQNKKPLPLPPPKESKPISVEFRKESKNFKSFTDIKAVSFKRHKSKIKLGSKYAKGYTKKCNRNKALIKNDDTDTDMEEDSLTNSDEEYLPENDESDEWEEIKIKTGKKFNTKGTVKTSLKRESQSDSDTDYETGSCKRKGTRKVHDDGNQKLFIKRIRAYEKSELLKRHQKILESEDGIVDDDEDFTEFEENFKIPNSVWNKLYKYQQTGVRWLWELHQQHCGGIIGDEMGLGKTIQVIAFLVGLKVSNLQIIGDNFKGLGPVILVCPATVMHQWVKEFHTWWPPFRVAILHESGSYVGKKELLVHQINKSNGILITSYAGVVQHQKSLLEKEWHYVILDEGHKIRNPDAQATLVVKQFRTAHRLILSGSPVQNNLKELWSLFDFIFPGKLGTLPVFMQQFSVPIVLGGYANASQVQVQTAYKCATVLRDTIKPYLLRRMKSDVKMSINLPNKSEQVLFCQLTEEQANLYKGYISSKEVDSILNARLQVFVGLINLRKICNHPDLFDGGPKIFKDTDISTLTEEEHYGYYKRSGKMIVVEALLRIWHKQGHRVLLFTQSRQMMEILEIFIKSKNYTYMKMDGCSSISSRQPAINKFNSDKSIFVFLLTTRVGGLGVNLTGADRVIIYDPDWNPSTDAQARERAWRIGQEKQVTIYRLLTAGTIEEKIYHRQIFKQFVTNRVLKDPRQRRFFKSNDLYELFTFSEVGSKGTETSAIFAGTGSEIKVKKKQSTDRPTESERDSAFHPEKNDSVSFSSEKIQQMKMLAKKLSAELKSNDCKKQNDEVDKVDKDANKNNLSPSMLSDSMKQKCDKSKVLEEDKHKKHKSKRRKAQVVDGEKVEFLVKKDVYKPPTDPNEQNAKDDEYVLSKLFKTSGVHTALKHDKIVDSSDPDYMIVEGEASRVAKEAVKALKESRRMCARAEDGIPTWTGNHGKMKPRFGQKKSTVPFMSPTKDDTQDQPSSSGLKFGGSKDTKVCPSSNDLLSAIRKRKKVFGTDVNSDDETGDSIPSNQQSTKFDELLVDIRNFVAFGARTDGQATTNEIIEAFQNRLPPDQSAIFKTMLSKICDFHRTNGQGIWYLKEEFR